MSEPFHFPKHPLNDQPNPFQDEQGANPFADERGDGNVQKTAESSHDAPQNIYEVGAGLAAGPPVRSYQPGDFDAVLPHRAGLVASLGIVGLVFSLAWSFFCLRMGPLSWVFLGATIPAWLLGQHDLRAIKVGAMDAYGLGMTRVGWICGMIGTVVTVVSSVYHIWLFVIAITNW